MDRYRNLFIKSSNISRDSYLWNTLSATAFALQSAILLIVIGHTNGLEDAGVFSIAYAIGSLMYFIGEFGVRRYQISDINERSSFTDYHTHKLMTCAVMLVASLVAVFFQNISSNHSMEKTSIIMIVCIIKLIEAYSEVYFGRFQQMQRLDIAAKTSFFRTMSGIIGCAAALIMTGNLLISSIVWLISSGLGFVCSSVIVMGSFGYPKVAFRRESIVKITVDCFPLFLGSFLLLYVGNAPKYAIDACMADTDQAQYNYIFMPVFAIGLFSNFFFNPLIGLLARRWDAGEIKSFGKMVLRQTFIISGIAAAAILVALTIGCPVLGWIYGTDLTEFRGDLAILMVGGGMLAMVNLFTVVITVMEKQKYLTIGYVIPAIAAWIASDYAVRGFGIRGASTLYSALMAAATGIFAVIYIVFLKKKMNSLKGDSR